jgi:glycosyltransferase involved in cell wall biosynthesis
MRKAESYNVCMVAYAQYFNDARIKGYVSSLLKNGYRVHVFCLHDEYSQSLTSENFQINFLGKKYMGTSKKLYLLAYFIFFLKAIVYLGFYGIKNRYSVVHVHNQPDFLVFTALISKMMGSKIILDLHDIMMAGVMTKFNSSQKGLLFRFVKFQTKLSVAFCDVLFCADHSQQEFLIDNGIKKDNFYVFLNLPNDAFFKTRKQKQKADNITRVINHGTLSYRLGIDILIKAVEKASKKISVTLTLIGGGEQKIELVNYCQEKDLLNKIVFFKDFIPVEKLQEEIEKYDIGVISMRSNPVYERCMLPVKLLEYAYVGIPVITSDLYGIRKYFSDDMVEYVVPDDVDILTKKIILLAGDPNKQQIMVNNSLKLFNQYNWSNQERDYLAIIYKLIKS